MNNDNEKRITIEQFYFFKERCRKWQKKLGLIDWEITIDNCKNMDNLAEFQVCSIGRNAHIRLSMEWERKLISNRNLDRVALHECLELLLYNLSEIAYESANRSVIEPEIHKIIRVLENLLIGDSD